MDQQFDACGWVVQDYKHAAVAAAPGVAVREVPTEAGSADYVLFVDGQAVGVIEAKREGTTLTGVESQTRKYQTSYPGALPAFLVGPGTLTGVLDGFPEIAGSASGFATFVRFAIGSAGSAAVALFNDGTPKTFGVVVLVFSAITLAAVALAHSSKTAHPA